MSLKEQVGVSLDEIMPAKATVARLLASARVHIADARAPGISAQTRFSAAYTAIRMLADAVLNANGYRTLSSRPGNHHTAIQSLALMVALPLATVKVLNALRRQRNDSEYSGDAVPESAVAECVTQAEALLAHVTGWLRANRPRLL